MKHIKKINEVWDGQPLSWNRIDNNSTTDYFFTSSTIEYKVEIDNVGDDIYDIYHFKFYRKDNGIWITDKLTDKNNNNSQKFISISTIGDIFRDFFSNIKYDAIIYSSLKSEESRIKLYNSVAGLILSKYGGLYFNEDSKYVKYYVHYFDLKIKNFIMKNYKEYIKN